MPEAQSASATQPVLILDADQPSALAIVRSLARRGIAVHVASDAPNPLAAHSRHVQGLLQYPDPLREEAAFIRWMADCTHRFGLIIPVTERTVVPLLRHRQQLDDSRIAIAPSAALEQALDKDRTVALALALGIAVPLSITLHALDGLADAAARIGWPVVVKPARSVGQGDSQRVQLSVSYAHNLTELQAQAGHALRFGPVILQEFFQGDGIGIELIADQGMLRYAFQHRRLHEVPLTGGGSSLRISEAIVPALQAAATRLMRALAWHGVAMVEFKYQPATGQFRLMEINGRFWGSLPLAVAAGADFPAMLHELLTTGALRDHAPARIGVVCRQLARDIDWLEHVLRRAAPAHLVRLPTWREVLRDSLLVFSPRHHFDVQSLRDPRPGLVDLWRIARKQWQRMQAVLQRRRRLAQQRRAARCTGRAGQAMARARRVLFLCHGNINRSALAQAHAEGRHGGRLAYMSAGFHAPQDRPADASMVAVAARRGLDLQAWRSRTLTQQMVQDADVILAMELAHIDRLLQLHPAARGKTYLLGAAGGAGLDSIEIADPYGQATAAYERAADQVIRAVDGWFSGPSGSRSDPPPRNEVACP